MERLCSRNLRASKVNINKGTLTMKRSKKDVVAMAMGFFHVDESLSELIWDVYNLGINDAKVNKNDG